MQCNNITLVLLTNKLDHYQLHPTMRLVDLVAEHADENLSHILAEILDVLSMQNAYLYRNQLELPGTNTTLVVLTTKLNHL